MPRTSDHGTPDWRARVQGLVRIVPVWVVYVLAALPMLLLIQSLVTGGLGPDPAKVLERALGEWALRFLVLGLAITPLLTFARVNLVKYRRAVGLSAFWYVVAHLGTYVVLDYQFDWSGIVADLWKRPYITIGMAASLMLLALAVTSNSWSIKRMGAQAWKRLHWLVYPAVVLGGLHFFMLVKAWPVEPLVYLGLTIALLALRLPAFQPTRPLRRGRKVQAGDKPEAAKPA